MKTRILMSVLVIGLAVTLIGGATLAWFTDEAVSEANTFAAGTLDLKVDGEEVAESISLTNMAPGQTSVYYKWVLRNDGTLPGKLSVSFSDIENKTNLINDPKLTALKEYYDHDYEWADDNEGHLGWFLKPGKHPDMLKENGLIEGEDYKFIERNDEEGWYIIHMEEEIETENSMGFSPVGWSVPSRIYSVWQTGPKHSWGTPGLNGLGGKTFGTFDYLPNDILEPGEEVQFLFRVSLDDNLQIWNGTKWIEAPDNMIQGDSVKFDIIFKLDQVTD